MFKALFDSSDSSVEFHEVASLGIIAGFITIAIMDALKGPVDLQSYGIGAGAVIAAIGGAGWLKGEARKVDPTIKKE